MTLVFPMVDDNGELNGAELVCKYKDITAFKHMQKYVGPGPNHIDTYAVMPDCVTIHVGDDSFEVKTDFNELKAKFLELGELFE